jgi:hypothetical protein
MSLIYTGTVAFVVSKAATTGAGASVTTVTTIGNSVTTGTIGSEILMLLWLRLSFCAKGLSDVHPAIHIDITEMISKIIVIFVWFFIFCSY